jgi:hypothetical protein
MRVVLPLWKGYLYSLMDRIRIYRQINFNQWRFGLSQEQVALLWAMESKYLTKGGRNRPKAHVYDALINAVQRQMGIATPDELEVAMRLNVVKLINVEDLIMELKNLKKFAAEVGLTAKDMAGKSDIELAKLIVESIDAEKEYSADFIAWYDSIPDGAFDQMDGIKESGAATSAAAIDAEAIDALIAHINGLSKAQEFKEVIADEEMGPIFADLDCSKFKLAPQFKKAMIEHLESLKAEAASEPAAETSMDVDATAIAKSIQAAKSVEDVIKIVEINESLFEGCELASEELADVKAALIGHLGVDLTPPSKPTSALAALKNKAKGKAETPAAAPTVELAIPFDPTNFDPNEIYEAAGKLQIGVLRKFYRQVLDMAPIEVASEPGMKKDIMLDAIATALVAIQEQGPKVTAAPTAEPAAEPAAQECEMQVNSDLIKKAVGANDKDALVAMCDAMGIKLNALQKRSIPQMEKLLNEKVPAAAPAAAAGKAKLKLGAKKEEAAAEPVSESYLTKAFAVIEDMTVKKADEAAILEAVLPIYTAAGKGNKLIIKSRVKQLMEIVAIEHGLKKK